MSVHVLKRGLDVPIAGAASGSPESLAMPATVSIDPREFRGVVPRLAARPGDRVTQGQALFYDKRRPEIVFLSAVAGTVKEVRRGHRRVITDIIVEVDKDSQESASFRTWTGPELSSISREDARTQLLAGGLWYALRTRPLNHVPDPSTVPQAILICGTETGPLQPGPAQLLDASDKDAVQAGIHVLKALSGGAVHLTTLKGDDHPALSGLSGVNTHTFAGPHPAGDATVQVNHVCPPKGDEGRVWYASAWDVARIGRLFLEGRYDAETVYAAVGAGCTRPRFVKTVLGAPVADIVGGVADGEMRYIRGSVLTGRKVDPDTYGGWFTRAIHVLPEEIPRLVLGWMLPSPGRFSAHRAYLKGWIGGKNQDLRPALNGGHRGLVPVGQYRRVTVTPDIQPEFLMKALAANDLEESISLGMLEFSEEEAALCTYIDPSKIEFDVLLQKGLEMYEKEI